MHYLLDILRLMVHFQCRAFAHTRNRPLCEYAGKIYAENRPPA